ncbi:hypothetical protein GCM10022289_20950 [Pedobacter jeongneungensis]|uniref:Uncharacterized protein n=2 Tax=Pedobacter jeongneungensis TaxID=947309 RepID=A0ABP8BD34_9SPHI
MVQLDILWSIFHEYGHLIQRRPLDEELKEGTMAKYLRETDAWHKAETKASEFDILNPHFDEFKRYRAACQASYRIDE